MGNGGPGGKICIEFQFNEWKSFIAAQDFPKKRQKIGQSSKTNRNCPNFNQFYCSGWNGFWPSIVFQQKKRSCEHYLVSKSRSSGRNRNFFVQGETFRRFFRQFLFFISKLEPPSGGPRVRETSRVVKSTGKEWQVLRRQTGRIIRYAWHSKSCSQYRRQRKRGLKKTKTSKGVR